MINLVLKLEYKTNNTFVIWKVAVIQKDTWLFFNWFNWRLTYLFRSWKQIVQFQNEIMVRLKLIVYIQFLLIHDRCIFAKNSALEFGSRKSDGAQSTSFFKR